MHRVTFVTMKGGFSNSELWEDDEGDEQREEGYQAELRGAVSVLSVLVWLILVGALE
jgi:hypothetical protein